PPALEASVNPLHVNRNLRQCLGGHRRSSVPCRDYDRRYQLRPRSFMQAYRKLTLNLAEFLQKLLDAQPRPHIPGLAMKILKQRDSEHTVEGVNPDLAVGRS